MPASLRCHKDWPWNYSEPSAASLFNLNIPKSPSMLLFCRDWDMGGTRQKDLQSAEAAENLEDVGKSSEKRPGLVIHEWAHMGENMWGRNRQEPRAGCRERDKLERWPGTSGGWVMRDSNPSDQGWSFREILLGKWMSSWETLPWGITPGSFQRATSDSSCLCGAGSQLGRGSWQPPCLITFCSWGSQHFNTHCVQQEIH